MEDESTPTPKKYEQLDQSIGPGNLNSEKRKRRKSGELAQSNQKILTIDFQKAPRKSGEILT